MAHLLQPGHLQAVGLVDQDQGGEIGLGTLTPRRPFEDSPPLVLPAGDLLGRYVEAIQAGAAVVLIQGLDLSIR